MKNKKGITLVALIITIIVMLILATITFSLIFGEDGIIARVKIAKKETERANIHETLMSMAQWGTDGKIDKEKTVKNIKQYYGTKANIHDVANDILIITGENGIFPYQIIGREIKSNEVNLLKNAEIIDNSRFSETSKGAIVQTGTCNYWCLNDFIKCDRTDIIRVFLPNESFSKTEGKILFYLYGSDKKMLTSFGSNTSSSALKLDADGKGWTFNANKFGEGTTGDALECAPNIAYIRICGTKGTYTGDEILMISENKIPTVK